MISSKFSNETDEKIIPILGKFENRLITEGTEIIIKIDKRIKVGLSLLSFKPKLNLLYALIIITMLRKTAPKIIVP
tara:strand:+ start:746 stop:973 length:228 start_codon:yes stop_codon:yes gene_type:complete